MNIPAISFTFLPLCCSCFEKSYMQCGKTLDIVCPNNSCPIATQNISWTYCLCLSLPFDDGWHLTWRVIEILRQVLRASYKNNTIPNITSGNNNGLKNCLHVVLTNFQFLYLSVSKMGRRLLCINSKWYVSVLRGDS